MYVCMSTQGGVVHTSLTLPLDPSLHYIVKVVGESWIHSFLDNLATKLKINNRTDAKADVNLLSNAFI